MQRRLCFGITFMCLALMITPVAVASQPGMPLAEILDNSEEGKIIRVKGRLTASFLEDLPAEYYLFDETSMVSIQYSPELVEFVGSQVEASALVQVINGEKGLRILRIIDVTWHSPLPEPTQETAEVAVILIEFQDISHSASHSPGFFENMLFTGPSSMKDYYAEVSYGKYHLSGTVYDWVRSAKTLEWYGKDGTRRDNGNGPIWQLAREAVLLSDPQLDFSSFDGDGDGIVDHVIIVYAGEPQSRSNNTNDIWPHKFFIFPGASVDGVQVASYSLQSESSYMGTFAHEFGHDLGLPDLYDNSGEQDFLGQWGLMASGSYNDYGRTPAHITSWGKIKLGWLSHDQVAEWDIGETTFSLTAIALSGTTQAVRIPLTPTKYYLVESRLKIGFDSALPGTGVLVLLIDETKGSGQGPVILQGTSPYTVGETFTDPLTETEVRVDSQGQSGFTVHFSRDLILERGAEITSISATFGTSSIDVVQTNNTKVSAGIDRRVWFNVTARNNNLGFLGADLYTTLQKENGSAATSSIEDWVWKGGTSEVTRWYLPADYQVLLDPLITRFAIRLWWNDSGVHKLQDEKQFELHTVSLKTLNFTSTVPKVSKGGDGTTAFILFKNGGNDIMFDSRISIVDTKGLIFSSTIESVNEIPPDSFASTSFDISASPQLASGGYRPTVQIRYQDFAGVEKIETFELMVNVTKMLTAVDLSAPEDLELGQNVILRAKVLDENGQPVSGQNVVFKLDSTVLGSAVTNGLGEATLSYLVEAKAGSYTLSAQFAGSDIHEQSSTSIQLRIEPLTLVIKTDFPNIEIATIAGTAHVSNSEGDVRVEIDSLDRISVEVKPAVDISGGSRGTFFQWSDGIKDNPRIIDLVGDLVLTAEYKTQHSILAESPYGEVSGSGWYDHGTTATIRLTATLIEHDNQTRRVFSQWSGDLVTSDIVFQTVMNSPKTLQAHWATQYFLSVSSDIGSLEGSGWYDRDLVRNATSGYAINKGASNRWSLSAYELDGHLSDVERNSTGEAVVPLPMDKPHTLIFRFTEQFELEIDGGRDVSFSPLSPTGDMWFDKGNSVTVRTSNSWPLQEGSRTRLTGWQIDGGETFAVKAEGSATIETATVRMDAPHLLVLLGVIQHSLDVKGGGEIEFNPSSPSSDIWFDDGMNVSVTTQRVWDVTSNSRLNFAEWLLDGVVKTDTRETSGSFSTPLIEMDRGHTVVFVPIIQHRILVHSTSFGLQWGNNVEIKGSITDDDWFDVGRPIQVTVDSTWDLNPEDSRKRLISWQVDDGKVVEASSQDGRFSTPNIIVKAAHDIYFNGMNQYFLKVISPYGEVEGQGWYDEGTNAEATAQTAIDLGNGTRRVFAGWQGALDNPSNIVLLEMKSPASLRAGWKTQFLVTVTSPYGKVEGAGWYDESSTATITMLGRTVDQGNATRRVFVTWHGDVEAMDSPYSFSIRDPKVIQTSWRSDYLTSLVFTGRHGREVIPASITITMANGSATELSQYSNLWITKGDLSIESITWERTNVVQTDQGRLSVIEPSTFSVPVAVRDIEIQVSDPLGLPLIDAPVSVILPNSTKVVAKTSNEGTITLKSIAEGEYTTSAAGLVQTVEASEQDDFQQVTVFGTAPILGVMALVSVTSLVPALIILRKRRLN